jgi:thiaminase/transcriptional activator TenA
MTSKDQPISTRFSTVLELVARHAEPWREAAQHRFLDAVREGRLPPDAFAAWLTQDYLYVNDLLAFQAHLLARAPRPSQQVLVTGLVALEAELTWFESRAQARGMRLNEARHPVTEAYRAFLVRLDGEPYVVGITALWALERIYQEAWSYARPGAPGYREFVEHWTVPEFATYVAGLEQAANDALIAEGALSQAVEQAFLETVELERRFWDMAWTGGRS